MSQPEIQHPDILDRAAKYRGDYGKYASGYDLVGDMILEIERLRNRVEGLAQQQAREGKASGDEILDALKE